MITAVDLFCGVGGLTHGLVNGGIRVAAGIDIDLECRYPYERNNNAAFIHADVKEVSGEQLNALWASSRYSLLAGCAPCQPFSTYSLKGRPSRKDTMWALVSDFGRLVKEAQPHFVTMENVPQLIHHPVFKEFIAALDGYHVWQDVVDCALYGVPQTRKRLVMLASRLGSIKELMPANPMEGSESTTVRKAISHLRAIAAGQTDLDDPLHSASSLSQLNLRRIRASKPGGTWRDWDESLLANCHRKASGDTYPSVYGRMEWDALAPTITTQCFGYGNGRFGHPEQDRAISLREAALLQTFPESYQFIQEGQRVRFNVLGRLIGNAVPVRLGEVIGKTFVNHVREVER